MFEEEMAKFNAGLSRRRNQFNPGTIGRACDDHLISLSGLKQHLAVSEASASRAV